MTNAQRVRLWDEINRLVLATSVLDRRPNISSEDARRVRGVTAYCDESVLPADAIEAAQRIDKALREHGEKARG